MCFNILLIEIKLFNSRNFTELHLSQIKNIVPNFFKFTLVKSSKEVSSYELVIAPVYGKYAVIIILVDLN